MSPKLVPEQGGPSEMPQVDPLKVLLEKADADKAEASKAFEGRASKTSFQIKSKGRNSQDRRVAHPWQGHDHVGRRALLEQQRRRSGAGIRAEFRECSASAGSAHLPRWWHWQRWRARSAAPWRPRASGISAALTRASVADHALEASVARLDADIQALKVGADHASRLGMTQFNKTSERLDKVEKAQLEPAAKLAKLSEAVEKLHAAPPVAAAAAATQPAAARKPPARFRLRRRLRPKVEVARLPTVEGWSLRDVANGGALIEGRQGIFEVYAGDPVPGLGRIDAIRSQDGHWVVVTSRGLIVAR